jgi:hypothetical protein
MQDGAELDFRIRDFIAATAADANTEPVVACCLIGVDNYVVALALSEVSASYIKGQ